MKPTSEPTGTKITPKSDVTSPTTSAEALAKNCGGMPPKKSVEQIDKVNTPGGHGGKAPGSVRV